MPIYPLAPGAFKATNAARMLTATRTNLDDLQRQLASGKKSETYGGLGAARITSLEMRAKAFEINSYQSTIITAQIRVKQMDLSLTYLSKISDDVRSTTILPQYDPDSSGKTSMQKYARTRLDEVVDMLNSEVNGARLFSGRKTDVRPVLDANIILNGDSAGRAGVQQLTVERKAADLGTGTGRLVLAGAGTTATLAEDAAHPFGFKLSAASSTSAGITVAFTPNPPPYTVGPAGNVALNVTANPTDGEQVRFELTLPDGTKQAITLTARPAPLTPVASAGQFEIGATPADTATNLRASIAAVISREATTSLPSASAKAAANAFFAGSNNSPPLRVVGPPATATALAAGTAANTVIWYQGDDQSPSARFTGQAKIDTSVTVGIGAQANEEGIRRLMANLAVFTNESFTTSAIDKGRYQAMSDGIRGDLGQTSGVQRVQDIQVEIAMSAVTMKMADERHKTKLNFVETIISDVEDSNQEETAAKLLSLQTKMQAAYQTTAILSRLNLTDYLR